MQRAFQEEVLILKVRICVISLGLSSLITSLFMYPTDGLGMMHQLPIKRFY